MKVNDGNNDEDVENDNKQTTKTTATTTEKRTANDAFLPYSTLKSPTHLDRARTTRPPPALVNILLFICAITVRRVALAGAVSLADDSRSLVRGTLQCLFFKGTSHDRVKNMRGETRFKFGLCEDHLYRVAAALQRLSVIDIHQRRSHGLSSSESSSLEE